MMWGLFAVWSNLTCIVVAFTVAAEFAYSIRRNWSILSIGHSDLSADVLAASHLVEISQMICLILGLQMAGAVCVVFAFYRASKVILSDSRQ